MNDQGSFTKDVAAVCGATILLVALLLGAVLLWAPAEPSPRAPIRTADQGGQPDHPRVVF